MKGMKVEVVSREIIKPSSPTPPHLRHLKLSSLDQLAPPIYTPIILFYHPLDLNLDPCERSCQLKNSLEATLTHFYPLAGRLRENFSIECNDEGVDYVETRVTGCKISEVIEEADMNSMNQLLPFEPFGSKKEVLLGAQFNAFDCGGVVIGVCISHKISDGTSTTTFLNAWAATTCGGGVTIDQPDLHPIFDAASHFPPAEIPGFWQNIGMNKDEKIVIRKFVFEKSKITALKEQAAIYFAPGSQEGKLPTRVEAVTALMWKLFMAISRSKTTPPKLVAAIHVVNLRPRMVPPLAVNSIGNIYRSARDIIGIELEEDLPTLAVRLRNAISRVNNDYVSNLRENIGGYLDSMKKMVEPYLRGEIETYNFTSWCRFPLYEVDFGWGTPAWVCSPIMLYKNLVVLMSTKDGDGIEAWVSMVEEDMHLFENDPELLAFVSSSKSSH